MDIKDLAQLDIKDLKNIDYREALKALQSRPDVLISSIVILVSISPQSFILIQKETS
jgi:hypothetical protein